MLSERSQLQEEGIIELCSYELSSLGKSTGTENGVSQGLPGWDKEE